MEEKKFFTDYQNLINSFEALKKSEDNPFFKSKYVPLKVILPLVKEHCKKNNFIFTQFPLIVDGKNTLQTRILHESGTDVSGSVEIVAKDATDPQKIGAGITYMRRYMLTCMFGLEEDDDDGNTAAGKAPSAQPASQSLVKAGICSICGTEGIAGKYGAYCPNRYDDAHKGKPKPTFSIPANHTPAEKKFIESLPPELDKDGIPIIRDEDINYVNGKRQATL
jgi:hypothetical protein